MTKISLIEDDQTMRRLLTTLLGLEGYIVSAYTENSSDGILDYLEGEKPEFLILDVHLKFGNGIDILQSIRGSKKFSDLKILMTSGLDYKGQCLQAGANDFFQKPYMPDQLINWLQNNRLQN